MRKYRNEIKYIVSKAIAMELKSKLSGILDFDSNANENGEYIIKSLYFDDLENTAYYEKMDGVLYRKKYRIRTYNDDDRFIRLERKYKHNNLTSKDQMLISKEIYSKILSGNVEDIEIAEDNLLNQFIMEIRAKHLIPSVIVEYKRTPFTYPLSNIRITLDEKIKSGRYNYDILDNKLQTYDVIGNNEVVLEVKYDEFLPEHIEKILETVPAYRQAVSKFALCRSAK